MSVESIVDVECRDRSLVVVVKVQVAVRTCLSARGYQMPRGAPSKPSRSTASQRGNKQTYSLQAATPNYASYARLVIYQKGMV